MKFQQNSGEVDQTKKGRNEENKMKVVGKDCFFKKNRCKDRKGQKNPAKAGIVVNPREKKERSQQ